MIYHLLYPLHSSISAFNIFKYITFRASMAFITALILSVMLGTTFIAWLQRLKFGQCIKTDVVVHQQKAGTPTMGGLLIGFSVLVAVGLWGDWTNSFFLIAVGTFISFGFVGFLDDYLKIKRNHNNGLSSKQKFLSLAFISIIILTLLSQVSGFSELTILTVPFFKNVQIPLGYFYIPFAVFLLLGSSNGVNLTDGLDGLAIGPVITSTACFGIFLYASGNINISKYLHLFYIAGVGEVVVFGAAVVGACFGFLWFNAYPAQIFMGDVGSLSLGGVVGIFAILCKQELLLLIIGGLFVVETLSVILQVGYFRMSKGRRIFLMAPLHHHFELKGIPESKIIVRFWILSILLAVVALSTLKIR